MSRFTGPWRPFLFALVLLLALSACRRPEPAAVPTQVARVTAESRPPAVRTAVPPPTPLPLPTTIPPPTASATPTAAVTVEASPTPAATATPDPYDALGIEALAARAFGGGQVEIVDTLEQNDRFARYLITYPSDGLTIYGFMNVPNEGWHLPVAIVLHGYVAPSQYQTLAYTTRYADSLAEAGYFTIHPNLRGYPPSDAGPDPFRTGFAIDVLNLIAIIREQSQDPLGTFRRADADQIHLWGHSMGGGVALRVVTVNNEPYLRAAALYASMSGDERLNYERIDQWSNGTNGRFELDAPAAQLEAISPIYHLERIQAALSVHHSEEDDVVPVEWSADLCQRLELLGRPAECHFYQGLPHTFNGAGDAAFMAAVVEFFNRH